MRSILCFGDSNTYGLKPNAYPWTRDRWAPEDRWPNILGAKLGVHIICEGLPGRTAASINKNAPYLDALPAVPLVMESHSPIDLVIVMLCTNDLQATFSLRPEHIKIALAAVVKAVQRSDRVLGVAAPEVLVVAPPHVNEIGFRSGTFSGAMEKSLALASYFEPMATALGAKFIDAAAHVKTSPIDGIHIEVVQHQLLAAALAEAL
ncbi:GDSL-type esterase/lipase family protein [Rhizobium sp. PRIMUS64]|uniref:GDSL-type esterase/lipase family protein n=1 Tax=Rhizobium sp. PRIMUS64 TaxID=2908925 RepID=UPI001FF5CD42|nr:GDSL-type esterase/lipase family protein [Rhizobium sp. PRIMUS64]MCJ9690549.1 GDSL-type esterase/lipase family protein [Rhizobium sp. PRIMUS64]